MNQVREHVEGKRQIYQTGFLLAVTLLFFGWLFTTPPGLLGKADAVGYAVCHRIDGRSFHIGERQLPLCARCSGMFLGGVLGLAYQGLTGRRRTGAPPKRVILILALLVIAFGVDGVNSYLHLFPKAPGLYEPANWLRLLTGTGMGLVIAAALYPAFNQTVWLDSETLPAMTGLKSLAILLLLALVLDLLILTESWVVLYPLAIISAVGVVILMVMVYTMVLLMLFRLERRMTHWGEMIWPLAGGLFFALLQIATLDFVRFWFTQTWGGFPLLG